MPRNSYTPQDKKNMKTISKNLHSLIEKKGINQAQLSDRTGIHTSTLNGYFKGTSLPSPANVQKLADELGVQKWDIDPRFFVGIPSPSNLETNYSRVESITESAIEEISRYKKKSSEYNFFDTGISAGTLQTIDPFTSNEVQTINMPNALLGKYAGDKDIFISRINGESMNRCIPDESIIAIKKFSSLYELKDGDIVVFQDASEMSIKRYYNNEKSKVISFIPDSTDKEFQPIIYRYEDIQQINILGKVVMYTVEL